ncbi:uncharacterized protein LOC129769027 [Toxorhynchites rutilus septentrionalis]|uniref:uncharacterized protein LOC129769027 n=1 Tax=Toxorhynchites rutilus septentrionalis TaxID=329112 RepID=UPI00247A5C38|nr:uncharacterized protein LOC129769027 [Toxorhynchites rutilus septentrionalis]
MQAEKSAAEQPTALELKKLRKQQKRQAKRAAAAERQKKHVRDHLKREQNFSLETEKRVFQDWEQMCSDVKYEELHEEMLQMKQHFQVLIDRKNACIERLMQDRDEMYTIYSRRSQQVRRLVEYCLAIHKYFTTNLSDEYTEDCQTLLTMFRRETEIKEGQGNECTQQMEGALISLEEAMEQGLVDDRVEFIKKTDDNVNTHIERRGRLRDRLAKRMEQLRRAIEFTVDNYYDTIINTERGLLYQKTLECDKASVRIIVDNRSKMKALNRTIRNMRGQITSVELAGTHKKNKSRLSKKKLLEKIHTKKWQLEKMEDYHMDRMKVLSSEAHEVKKYLDHHHERGKLILNLAQTCASYECPDDEKYFQRRIDQGHSRIDCPPEFEFLFDKMNRVQAMSILLKESRDQLQQNNRALQLQFQEYCKLNGKETNLSSLQPVVKEINESPK